MSEPTERSESKSARSPDAPSRAVNRPTVDGREDPDWVDWCDADR